jgi:predicted metal-dependent peptidase
MSLKKIFITFILFFSMLSLSTATFAKEVKKNMPDVLKEVDAKIQVALDAIPSDNAQEVAELIKAANENAGELSANYKFEFERDKAQGKLKKARDAAKKSDLSGAEQELKAAKESFANLKNFL